MMRIGMVCEAASDHRTATTLAARVLERPVETTCINPVVDQVPTFSKWTNLNRHEQTWPRHHLNGRRGDQTPVHGQTVAARKALLLFYGKVDAVILMVDGDNEADTRRDALERARRESALIPSERIVVAVPQPEQEAWYIAAFEPKDAEEQERLTELRAELGKDPRTASHTLKHGQDIAKRNAKRVLDKLTNDDSDRAHEALQSTGEHILRERGQENGLTHFLDGLQRLK